MRGDSPPPPGSSPLEVVGLVVVATLPPACFSLWRVREGGRGRPAAGVQMGAEEGLARGPRGRESGKTAIAP